MAANLTLSIRYLMLTSSKNLLRQTNWDICDKVLDFHGFGLYIYEINPHTPLQPRYPKVIVQLKTIWSQAKGRGPESVEGSSHFTRESSIVETDSHVFEGHEGIIDERLLFGHQATTHRRLDIRSKSAKAPENDDVQWWRKGERFPLRQH
ncbi:hypothetical protein BO79DRAFT_258448 [Aspergillus costaricaensis CBS 115574]|uniref:Uncharacterized protein n=1 Tax=Aspergillus costaricaensis CBS 115574 TaxID=1448317 RepID=A0ACD1I4J2_9EURO|nr:hypothetical protein BO79DRAFT_258448 [Aspergillus costaricaensis CBS 115574]RAK85167.1 hypothetical protein BO79DRAFT_258448 [Aspergillus costaricaensis CBS 115574]